MVSPEPFDQELEMFLQGEELELDIDDIFAKDLRTVMDDFRKYAPDDIIPQDDKVYPSLFEPGYAFKDVPAGVLLIDPDGNVAGGYLSCDLVVDEDHRGKGLGIELVIERCLRDGENPVLNLDNASYSHKGLRAHELAWKHATANHEETFTRLRRWEGN